MTEIVLLLLASAAGGTLIGCGLGMLLVWLTDWTRAPGGR